MVSVARVSAPAARLPVQRSRLNTGIARRQLPTHIRPEIAMRLLTCQAFFLTVTLAAGAGALAQSAKPVQQGERNVPEFEPAFPEQTRAPASDSGVTLSAETFAEPLEHPWGIDRLPDGGYLVTELPGRMRVISANGEISDPVQGLPEV